MLGSELLLAAVLSVASAAPVPEHLLKFATLAPEGSTWMESLHALDRAVREKSGGKLGLKFYPGGVSGDEKDVVRKMRVGQLQAGGFTGLGLGEMAPEVRVLEVPFLTTDAKTALRVADGLRSELSADMRKRGFVLLAWAHPGFAYFLCKEAARTPADLRKLKLWAWEGDPIAEALYASLNVAPIPLSLPDVLTSLQTGLIQGAYATPLAAIALQWHTKVRYLIQVPLAFVCGGIAITAEAYDALPEDLRTLLAAEADRTGAQITAATQHENAEAMTALHDAHLETITPDAAGQEEFRQAALGARKRLSGKLFPQELLERAEGLAKSN